MDWLNGQDRRAWLDRQGERLDNALAYYLGPHAAPVNALAQIGAMVSPGQDFVDMHEGGTELMRGNALSGVGLMGGGILGMAIPGSASGYRKAADEMADTVLDLLKNGRASEVTDDMLAAANPKRLYDNYDLPMDEASRMGRAREMGFDVDTPLYHGTNSDFQAFDDARIGSANDAGFYGRGHYMENSPYGAEYYGRTIMPVTHKGNTLDLNNNTGDLTYTGHFKSWAPKLKEIGALDVGQSRALRDMTKADNYVKENVRFLKAVGIDGKEGWMAKVPNPAPGYTDEIVTRGSLRGGFPETKEDALDLLMHTFRDDMQRHHSDVFPFLGSEHASLSDYVRTDLGAESLTNAAKQSGFQGISYGDEVVAFDPANIRSQFARFDPRLAHLRNLSAGALGGYIGYNALTGMGEDEY